MTEQEQIEELKSLLWNKEWRLFSGSLYFIKDKYWKKVNFIPNKAQTIYYKTRHTKNIILKARQLGFSTFIDIDKLDDFLFTSYSNYWIIAQDIDSANFIFNEKVKFAYDNLPEWLKNQFKLNTDRKWEIKSQNNQNSISVDTSFRWWTLQWLHISEYWKICNKYPEKAREIQTWALNTVAPTSKVDIESTAEWNSWYFFDMTMRAIELQEQWKELSDMDYKFFFFAWFLDDTYSLISDEPIRAETLNYFEKLKQNEYIQKNYPNIDFTEWQMRWYQKKAEEQKDDMQREYPSFPKEAFDLAIKWAYYEKELSIARKQNRVWKFYYDERLPVYTSWDLWWAWWWDETAIWFFQLLWKEVRLIDYWEWSWYWLTEIAMTIVNPRYNNYDTHYLPHDAEVTEYSTGVARVQTARQVLKWKIEVIPKLSISDWINATRDMFPNCYFNEETCFTWLSRLAWYRREYDEKNWIFRDKPKHDINSNGADSFRYLGVKYKVITEVKNQPQRIITQARYF